MKNFASILLFLFLIGLVTFMTLRALDKQALISLQKECNHRAQLVENKLMSFEQYQNYCGNVPTR